MSTLTRSPLQVSLGRLTLANPVMPGSGTFEYDPSRPPPFDVNVLGAIVPKSITLRPQAGNPPPRLAETPSGLINSIGIPSPGLEGYLADVLPHYAGLEPPLVISVAGFTPEEYAELTGRLASVPLVDAIEVNLSCPNLETHRMPAQDVGLLRECMAAARASTEKPLWAKLSPQVTSIAEMARHAAETGADAVTCINTFPAMAIEVAERQIILGAKTGGLSGPAIKPLALWAVWSAAQAVSIPVIASGGIATLEDVLMFLLAGASAVQIGTASFQQPLTMPTLIAELEGYVREQGIDRLADLIGQARPPIEASVR